MRSWLSKESEPIMIQLHFDTPAELDYYRHGGILEYVLRQLLQN